ncbi:MAG TPA: hypothetical protein VIP51_11720 [Eoetvoesiella sp.]
MNDKQLPPQGAVPRSVTSREFLQKAIAEEVLEHAECAGVQFGGIYWHEVDETGCNWSVSIISGPEWTDCFIAMEKFIFTLRAQYNIPQAE